MSQILVLSFINNKLLAPACPQAITVLDSKLYGLTPLDNSFVKLLDWELSLYHALQVSTLLYFLPDKEPTELYSALA